MGGAEGGGHGGGGGGDGQRHGRPPLAEAVGPMAAAARLPGGRSFYSETRSALDDHQ